MWRCFFTFHSYFAAFPVVFVFFLRFPAHLLQKELSAFVIHVARAFSPFSIYTFHFASIHLQYRSFYFCADNFASLSVVGELSRAAQMLLGAGACIPAVATENWPLGAHPTCSRRPNDNSDAPGWNPLRCPIAGETPVSLCGLALLPAQPQSLRWRQGVLCPEADHTHFTISSWLKRIESILS